MGFKLRTSARGTFDFTHALTYVGRQQPARLSRQFAESRGHHMPSDLAAFIDCVPTEGKHDELFRFGEFHSWKSDCQPGPQKGLAQWLLIDGWKRSGYFNIDLRAALADAIHIGTDLGGNLVFALTDVTSDVVVMSKDDEHRDWVFAASSVEAFVQAHCLAEKLSQGHIEQDVAVTKAISLAPNILASEFGALEDFCKKHRIRSREPEAGNLGAYLCYSSWIHLSLNPDDSYDPGGAQEAYSEFSQDIAYWHARLRSGDARCSTAGILNCLLHGYLLSDDELLNWALRLEGGGNLVDEISRVIQQAQNGSGGELASLLRARRGTIATND